MLVRAAAVAAVFALATAAGSTGEERWMGISPAGDLPADEDSIDEDDEDSIDEDLDESIDKVERWGQTPD